MYVFTFLALDLRLPSMSSPLRMRGLCVVKLCWFEVNTWLFLAFSSFVTADYLPKIVTERHATRISGEELNGLKVSQLNSSYYLQKNAITNFNIVFKYWNLMFEVQYRMYHFFQMVHLM